MQEKFRGGEIKNALKKAKNNKNGGCGNIRAGLLKYGHRELDDMIANILNSIVCIRVCPREIKRGILIPLQNHAKTKGLKNTVCLSLSCL